MAALDSRSRPDSHLLAAAHAAASWARARRATWTDQPLPTIEGAMEAEAPVVPGVEPPVDALSPAMEPPPPASEPPPVVALPPPARESVVEREEGPTVAAVMLDRARTAAPAIGRWLAYAAVAGGLVAAVWVAVPYVRAMLPALSVPRPAVETAAPARQPAPARSAAGTLRVTSTPTGAHVLVDGKDRGVTPLTLGNLSPGAHDVTLTSSAGSVHRSVRVAANEAVDVDESIFAGWVAVLAPFDVDVSEGGRALRPDERNQILLAPGVHDLRLTNASLNYAAVQHVEVTPGATTTVRVTPPASTLTVTAAEVSEVWLDGARLGETPLNAAAAPLGTHEIVVRRPGGGERRFTVTIGTGPFTLNADAGR